MIAGSGPSSIFGFPNGQSKNPSGTSIVARHAARKCAPVALRRHIEQWAREEQWIDSKKFTGSGWIQCDCGGSPKVSRVSRNDC